MNRTQQPISASKSQIKLMSSRILRTIEGSANTGESLKHFTLHHPDMTTHKYTRLRCLPIALLWIAARFLSSICVNDPPHREQYHLGSSNYHLRSVGATQVLPCPVHSNTIYDMVGTHQKFIPPEQSRQIHSPSLCCSYYVETSNPTLGQSPANGHQHRTGEPSTLAAAVDWSHLAVCCDECQVWYHKTCAIMTSAEYDHIGSLSWKCCKCNTASCSSFLSQAYNLNVSISFDAHVAYLVAILFSYRK